MCTQGDTLNACFNIDVAEKIRKMLHYAPILTSIMLPFFKTGTVIATSSSVETEFSNIKNRVFKTELPLRVDKFIFRHLDFLDGRIKEAMAKCMTLTLKKKRKKRTINNLKNNITEECVQKVNFIDYMATNVAKEEAEIIRESDRDTFCQNYNSEITLSEKKILNKEIEKIDMDLLPQSDLESSIP